MSMQPLRLDFIKPAYPRWPGVLLLALALLVLAASIWWANDLKVQEAKLEQSMQLVTKPAKRVATAQVDMTAYKRDIDNAHDVAAFLTLPWRDLFAALELAATDEVTLLSIEPDHRKQQLRITAEATDFKAMVNYMKHLGEAPQLAVVHLEHYEEQAEGSDGKLRFSLLASWKLGS